MDRENITNSEMEAQFRERNTNLKNDINQAVNTATSKTKDMWESAQQQDTSNIGAGSVDNATQTYDNVTQTSTSAGAYNSAADNDAPLEIGHDANQWLMDSIRQDIRDMHSRDPDEFGHISGKIEDTFGENAL
ncbi:hypothetical protein G6F37_000331 [Rhizopus arrhizus]|jgi:uncharacterized FAD-dependent dehydrogenase|nr:hypothetical protein G6F38_000706 [Rhizopus arrhizus]KAG1164384.1 hypothetical protein G6F37_000331 [Rhizopus arrhizus]